MRKQIHLNYGWHFKKHFAENDIVNSSSQDYEIVNIPHTNQMLPYNNFSEYDYQFISSYFIVLEPFQLKENERVLVHFEAVMGVAEVYLDQVLVGTHKGGYTPFSFDITPYIVIGVSHRLFVKADARERKDIPPHGFVVDYLTYGGIYREVYLEIVPKTHIESLFVKTNKVNNENWKLELCMQISHPTGQKGDVEIICDNAGKQYQFMEPSKLDQKVCIEKNIYLPNVWDLEHPKLTKIIVRLLLENHIVDEVVDTFGFREIRVDATGLYLNGNNIKLIGLNRHQSYPYVGYAMPKNVQAQDADILKRELGVNVVRSSHYPPSKHFLNRCDEIGLLVFVEIPGWQHIGNEEWKEVAVQNTSEMLLRDRNHPSVFIWGVRINESSDDSNLYKKTNQIAKELDGTRPTGGVRNFAKSELLEDVYTYNDFIHRGSNKGLSNPLSITKKKAPYLVTEYNGHMFPTKKFDSETHRIDHALRHLVVQQDNFKYKDAIGAIGWCMNDYNTHKDFGSGDRICYHGVMDMFRIGKYAASVYSSQQSANPVLTVLSSMNIGEYASSTLPPIYVMTNCDYIKVYRNGDWIGDFYPSKDLYPDLPHPPVVISDFIGNQLVEHEKFSKKDSDRVKSILKAYTNYGFDMPIKYKIKMAYIMLKYKLKFEDATILFGKYLGDWGNELTMYEFEGFLHQKPIKKVIKGTNYQSKLSVIADSLQLVEDITYDATRIVVRCLDEFGNDLIYANNTIQISVSEELEVIGPKSISLIGGSIAFWVKTNGKSGVGKVSIHSDYLMDCQLEIIITKI